MNSWLGAGAVVCCAWLCCARLGAQDAVRITGIDGKESAGTLRGLDPQGRLMLETTDGTQLRPLDEVRLLEQAVLATPELQPAGLLMLRSGQVLRADVQDVRTDASGTTLLVLLPPARTTTAFPVRTVRGIRPSEQPLPGADSFDEALRDRATSDRMFYLRPGSQELRRLTVDVKRFVREGDDVCVVAEFDGKEQRPKPLRELYGLVLGQGAAPDEQKCPRATVETTGGGPFTGSLAQLDPAADRLVLRFDEGGELVLPWSTVQRIKIRSDKLVYLSDLEPVSVEQTPALARKWPWLKDRAPSGADIVLRGTRFARGLVLVPRTKLTFDLGGRFDHFETVVGIDDRSGDMADADVRILGDDKVLFEVKHLARATAPQPVRVVVTGVRRLVLEADFGERLDFGDHCAFAEARALRDG